MSKPDAELKRLRILNHLLRSTKEAVSLADILAALRTHLGSLVAYDRLGLLVAEPHGRFCVVHETVTQSGLPFCPPGSLMPIEGTAIEWLFRERRPQVNRDLEKRQEFLEDQVLLADGIRSIARIPLVHGGTVYGVMTIKAIQAGQFPEESLDLLEQVALHIGGAVFVARQVMELKILACTDALTETFNRRALHAIHSSESFLQFARDMLIDFEGDVHSLSILLIDVDDFKLYNDAYGHDEGDRRLAAFVRVLRDALSPNDLVFRYGGDEFLILLPGVSKQEAFETAARIRLAAGQVGDHRGEPIPVSIGIECDSWEGWPEMIRAADAAMYADKRIRQASGTREFHP